MANIIIIPVHLESKRLPGKSLFPVGNKIILQMVYDQCCKSNADKVFFAIPRGSKLLYDMIGLVTGKVSHIIFTDFNNKCKTGTQRVADAAIGLLAKKEISNNDHIINVQVDYPTIDPKLINDIFKKLMEEKNECWVTGYYYPYDRLQNNWEDHDSILKKRKELLENPNYVKLVTKDGSSSCLYFSRKNIGGYIHIGIYGFSNYDVLKELSKYTSSLEDLEQLPWLGMQYPSFCIRSNETLAINTLEDYKQLLQDQ